MKISSLAKPGTGRRRRAYRLLAIAALLVAMALAGTYFAGPWLGKRFNRFFESLIGKTLNIPILIESIETAPFSHLTLTRLRSVSAAEQGKITFEAREISFYYDPVELLAGRLRKLVLAGPRMFLNLDADLQGIAQVPELPPPPSTHGFTPRPEGDFLPFSIAETIIQSGDVTLQFEGRSLELTDLRITVFELGRANGQSVHLQAEAFGAAITVEGKLDLTMQDGRLVPRYVFHDVSIKVEDLALARFIDWLMADGASPASPHIKGMRRRP